MIPYDTLRFMMDIDKIIGDKIILGIFINFQKNDFVTNDFV